jgi:serine protease Do
VDNNNKVVGINYSGLSETNQYWAISSKEALKIIGQLREGQDVNSLGVNGEAIPEDAGGPGIWVYSVEAESPAGEAGVRAGDFITKLAGLDLATDGTMADYCDIVRTHGPKDTISIEVFRPGTEEVLEGELNGRNLKPAAHTSSAEAGYTKITDESGALVMEVPSGWSEVDGAPWAFEGETVGAALRASADLEAYTNTWEEPGVSFAASRILAQEYTAEEFLDHPNFDYSAQCQKDGRYEYDDGVYKGVYDLWTNCGETGTAFMTLTAMPRNQEFMTLVQLQANGQVAEHHIKHILSTFDVVGEL